MADVTFRPIFDDSEIDRALKQLEEGVQSVDREIQKLGDEASKSFAMAEESATAMDNALTSSADSASELSGTLRKTGNEVRKTGGGFKGLRDAVSQVAGQVNIMGVNLGGVVDKLRQKQSALKGVEGGLGTASRGLKAFRVALISTGIGAIIVLLSSLAAAFTSGRKNVEGFGAVMKGLTTVFNVLIDRGTRLINSLVKLVSGDFKGAAEEARGAFVGLGKEIRTEILLAAELERQLAALKTATREFNIETAKQQSTLDALRRISDDTNKSYGERIKALKEIASIQESLDAQALNLAAQNLLNIQQNNRLREIGGELNDDQLQAEADARIELYRLQADINARRGADEEAIRQIQREAYDELKARQEEEKRRVEELTKAYEALILKFAQAIDAARLTELEGIERLQEQRRQALEQVEQLRLEIEKAATAAGKTLPDNFQEGIQQLINAVEVEFKRGVDELRGGEVPPIVDLLVPDPAGIAGRGAINAAGERAKELSQQAFNRAQNEFNKARENVFESLKNSVLASLGLSEEQAGFIVQQFSSVFQSVQEISALAVQQQLAEQDALIEKSKERINELQNDIQRQNELREQGFANDLASAEQALAAENKVLADAQAKRLEIEKKQARQQLIIDALQQASQLGLAAAKLIANEAGKGLVGIVTGAAGLALLFSIIAKAKAQAQAFSQPAILRKGERLQGPAHEQGGIPLLIGKKRLVEAEGGEWLIGSKPSREHDGFLERLNKGKYKGMDLVKIVEGQARSRRLEIVNTENRNNAQRIQEAEQAQQFQALAEAYSRASDKATKEIIAFWKTRPVDTPTKDGIIRETEEGNTKIRTRIKTK